MSSPGSRTAPRTDWPAPTSPVPTTADEFRAIGAGPGALARTTQIEEPRIFALAAASPDNSDDGDVRRGVVDAVDAHIGTSRDPSLAVAAVIGEGIGRLTTAAPDWAERHRSTLFAVLDGDDDVRRWADVVVSVALRVYRSNIGFLELMRPAISDMLTPAYPTVEHTEGWRGHEPAVHAAAVLLVHVHLLGDIDREDPQLQQLFSTAVPDTVVAAAIGRIGWQLMRTRREAGPAGSGSGESDTGNNEPPQEYLSRARDLIDQRVADIDAGRADAAELTQFHWWVQSHLFEPSWWLPVLLRAATHPDFEIKGRFGAALAEAAQQEPTLAMAALAQLHRRREGTWSSYDLLQNAPAVIAAAQRATDGDAATLARQFTNLLARQGHFDVLDRIDELTAPDSQDGGSKHG